MSEIDFDKKRREITDEMTSAMVVEELVKQSSDVERLIVIWVDRKTQEIRSLASSGEFKNLFELIGLLEAEKLRRLDDLYDDD